MGKCVCFLSLMFLTFVYQSTADITAVDCTVGDTSGNGDSKCETEDSNAECPGTAGDASKCACTTDYFLSSDKTQCIQSILEITCTPGDATEGNTKCDTQYPNTECPTGSTTCKCKPNHYLSSDGKQCVQKITTVACTPADASDGDTKCQKVDAKSECKTGATTCTCKGGYTGTDSCTKVLGGTCPTEGECSGSVVNSVCTAQKCECAANFIEESDICKTAIGQACTGGKDCVLNAECEDTKCKCSSGYKDTDGLCAAESSATSVWMATSLQVTFMLIYLPRFMLW